MLSSQWLLTAGVVLISQGKPYYKCKKVIQKVLQKELTIYGSKNIMRYFKAENLSKNMNLKNF